MTITIHATELTTRDDIVAVESYEAGSVTPKLFDVADIEALSNGCIRVTFTDGLSDTFHPLGMITLVIK